MIELFQAWVSAVTAMGFGPVVAVSLILLPVAIVAATWFIYTKKIWVFRNVDRSAGYRRFAIDWEEFKNTRRYELEQIVRANTVALINSLIYPYIREHYLYRLDDAMRSARHSVMQPTMIVMKYRINEVFYQAIKENGFQEISESGQRSTYCWKKSGQIIEAVDDVLCRFMNAEEIINLKVFNRETEYCKTLLREIYELLDRDYDQTRPGETGVITQIMQHDARTKIKAQELTSDPFGVYHNISEGGM